MAASTRNIADRTAAEMLDRILVLVPHDPGEDPRVGWVMDLCREIARTDVIGVTWSAHRQTREYDGRAFIERANTFESSSAAAKMGAGVAGLIAFRGDQPRAPGQQDGRLVGLRGRIRGLAAFAGTAASHGIIVSALRRRARAVSIAPALVVCHDIYTLPAGLLLRSLFGSSVLYDSHEFWPAENLFASRYEQMLTAHYERRLARQADAVVTISPPLARHLEQLYGLSTVLVVPNATPFRPDIEPSFVRRAELPVRFLLQGRVAPRRGTEDLLEAWARLDDDRVVLYVRAPENAFLAGLRLRFADAVARGRLTFLPPVHEDDLVSASTFADVGVIPYSGNSLNHRFACPNKLSQYMHAGLAIVSAGSDHVRNVVASIACGEAYDPADPATLAAAVSRLCDLAALERAKRNAYEFAQREYNWQVQSQPYRAALERLFDDGLARRAGAGNHR